MDTATIVALPTVDGGNLDMVVTYVGDGMPAYLNFAAPAAVGSAIRSGEVVVQPNGVPILLTANAATLAAAVANPLVIQSPNHGAASTVGIIAGMRGGTLTFTRGTATSRLVF
jgi:hypothetical protein